MMYHLETDDDIAAAALAVTLWPDLFEDMPGSSNTSAPQGVHEDSVTAYPYPYPSTADAGLPNLNAGNDTAFTPTPTASMGTFTSHYLYPNDANAWAMQVQAFPDTGSVASQLLGDSNWSGVSPYAVNSAATTPNLVVSPSSSTTPPSSEDGLAWDFGPGQSIYHPTSSSFKFGGGSEGGLVAPEFGADNSGAVIYPVEWATNEVAWPIHAAPESSATAAPGKRRRVESHGDRVPAVMDSSEMPPQKRVRGGKANGILKTPRSATRTRHKPVARNPKQKINNEPKQPVRGAERLATPDSQGLHHRSLLGPSPQQGWAGEAADGQLVWVEGSVEDVGQGIDSTVLVQQQQEEEEYFEIPEDLKTAYRALLVATQADWAHGAVREIKCRFCPNAKFKKWVAFKRHCENTETHPFSIYFCERCAIHFARSDSCKRHYKTRLSECLQTTREKADEKRRETQRQHDEFIARLEGWTTGEESIGTPFWKTIKDKYPNSSKKYIEGSGE